MKNIRSLAARGLSFAHLAGLSSRGARAEGDDPNKDDPENKDGKGAGAEGDDPNKEPPKEGRRAQREDETDEEYAEYNDDEDRKEENARHAEGQNGDDPDAEDDDDDEEMRGKSAAAKARRREQARCAAIFAAPAAARNPVLAANLAFKTRMTRTEAIAMLEGTPAPASAAHANRAARNPNLGIDGSAKQSPQQALAARWDQNLKAANPSRR